MNTVTEVYIIFVEKPKQIDLCQAKSETQLLRNQIVFTNNFYVRTALNELKKQLFELKMHTLWNLFQSKNFEVFISI